MVTVSCRRWSAFGSIVSPSRSRSGLPPPTPAEPEWEMIKLRRPSKSWASDFGPRLGLRTFVPLDRTQGSSQPLPRELVAAVV